MLTYGQIELTIPHLLKKELLLNYHNNSMHVLKLCLVPLKNSYIWITLIIACDVHYLQ